MRKLVFVAGCCLIMGMGLIPVGCFSVLKAVHVQTPMPIMLISAGLMAAMATAGGLAVNRSLSYKHRFPDER